MRYPGPEEDSESNSLLDFVVDNGNEMDHIRMFYDSTLSEYSPSASQDEGQLLRLRDQYQHPARPTTPEPQHVSPDWRHRNFEPALQVGSMNDDSIPGPSHQQQRAPRRRTRTDNFDSALFSQSNLANSHISHSESSSSSEHFAPMISINVPSRQNQRLSRARRNSNRIRSNTTVPRVNDQSDVIRTNNSNRPGSLRSRIPIPIQNHSVFRYSDLGLGRAGPATHSWNHDREIQFGSIQTHNTNMQSSFLSSPQTSVTNTVFSPNFQNVLTPSSTSSISYLNHTNPELARFIQPPSNSPQTILKDSSTQTEIGLQTTRLRHSSTEINLTGEESLRFLSDEELAFDNLIRLGESSFVNCGHGTFGVSSPIPQNTNQEQLSPDNINDSDHSRCESAGNSSNSSIKSVSGLSMKSREVAPEKSLENLPDSSEDEDSDTSTQREVNVNTVSSSLKQVLSDPKKTITRDEEIPGPSEICKQILTSAELTAELVLDSNTILKNGKCKLTFSDLQFTDLTDLLNQDVSLKLERGHVVVLTVNRALSHEIGKEDCSKPIYRKISRYLGGQVIRSDPIHAKKVSFCDVLVDKREYEETESVVSSSAEVAPEWSADVEDDEMDILGELEELEDD